MVTLYREARWKIAVYGRDHGVPHFHIEGPGWRCSVSIATLDLIIGRAPKAEFAAAIGWAARNRDQLTSAWRRLNP
jgi:hypothetical protein